MHIVQYTATNMGSTHSQTRFFTDKSYGKNWKMRKQEEDERPCYSTICWPSLASEDMDNWKKWLNAKKIDVVGVLHLTKGKVPKEEPIAIVLLAAKLSELEPTFSLTAFCSETRCSNWSAFSRALSFSPFIACIFFFIASIVFVAILKGFATQNTTKWY